MYWKIMSNFFEKSDLSRNEAENIISDTLKNCDDGELYLENSKSENILFELSNMFLDWIDKELVTIKTIKNLVVFFMIFLNIIHQKNIVTRSKYILTFFDIKSCN